MTTRDCKTFYVADMLLDDRVVSMTTEVFMETCLYKFLLQF